MNMTVLPGLADDGSGPVFASPWQAQIFSLVVGLHESGCFSWNEWAEALSREIAEDSSGGADGEGRRPEAWRRARRLGRGVGHQVCAGGGPDALRGRGPVRHHVRCAGPRPEHQRVVPLGAAMLLPVPRPDGHVAKPLVEHTGAY